MERTAAGTVTEEDILLVSKRDTLGFQSPRRCGRSSRLRAGGRCRSQTSGMLICGRPLALLLSCTLVACGLAEERPPSFLVDLSLPASRRWEGALTTVLAQHPWEWGFQKIFEYHNATLFNYLQPHHWALLGGAVRRNFPDYAEELKSISLQFLAEGHHVSFQYLSGWAYFHELSHSDVALAHQPKAMRARHHLRGGPPGSAVRECTAVAAAGNDGHVLFGGNMDQSPVQVRNVTLQVDFIRGYDAKGEAQWVLKGVDWYWFTAGVTRAVRKGVGTFQENWREGAEPLPLARVMRMVEEGRPPQNWVAREALAAEPPRAWAQLLEYVGRVPLASPFYVAITGPGLREAAVVSRGLDGSDELAVLGGGGDEPWFLVQANTDMAVSSPQNDPRRFTATKTLWNFGQAEANTHVGMLAVLSTYPTYNPHTAYSVTMDAHSGEFHVFVRVPMCPETRGAAPMWDGRYCKAVLEDVGRGPTLPQSLLVDR